MKTVRFISNGIVKRVLKQQPLFKHSRLNRGCCFKYVVCMKVIARNTAAPLMLGDKVYTRVSII